MNASLQWQRKHQVLTALLQRMLSTNPISDTSLFPEAGMIIAAAAFPTLLGSAGRSSWYCLTHRSNFTRILLLLLLFFNGKNAAIRTCFQYNFFCFPHNLPHTLGLIGVTSLIHTPCSSCPQRTGPHHIPSTLQTAFKAHLEHCAPEEAKECVASARGCVIRPSQS